MTDVILFHHAQGLTDGVREFADHQRAAGHHQVTVPDLYDGATFDAQTRPDAKGAMLFHACVPTAELGCPWPQGVPVQIHGMDADEVFVTEGDLDAARDLIETTDRAQLFLYQHLFADHSPPTYDQSAATLLTQRVLSFLDNVT